MRPGEARLVMAQLVCPEAAAMFRLCRLMRTA